MGADNQLRYSLAHVLYFVQLYSNSAEFLYSGLFINNVKIAGKMS